MTAFTKADKTTLLSNATAGTSAIVAISGVTAIDTTGYIGVVFDVVVTYNASATVGGRLDIYGSSDNSNWSSDAIFSFDIPFVANTTRRGQFTFWGGPRYLKPTVYNNSSGYTITAITIDAQTISAT
jgi:hypothetical protein